MKGGSYPSLFYSDVREALIVSSSFPSYTGSILFHKDRRDAPSMEFHQQIRRVSWWSQHIAGDWEALDGVIYLTLDIQYGNNGTFR